MNRAAVGLGSWLLWQGGQSALALDGALLDRESYRNWQAARSSGSEAERFVRLANSAMERMLPELLEQELREQEREILWLYWILGESMPRIAARLGLQPSSVSRANARALAKLRGILRYALRYRDLLLEEVTGDEGG
ncbi:MAG: hypothetical protein FWH26_06415 [Oscillospiraceae bacterium]|nr:hypothetical protein [Oscillospiraceae bacterium]